MKLTTYAEVFGPDHPLWQAYVSGFKKTPGHLLKDLLEETNGRYEVDTVLADVFLQQLREEVAKASARRQIPDSAITAALASGRIVVPFEHLRGLDPETTRIVYGCRFEPTDRTDPAPIRK